VLVVGRDVEKKETPVEQRHRLLPMPAAPRHNLTVQTQQTLREVQDIAANMRASFERIGLHAEGLAASNNWVVSGRHTVTGKPLLANDPHLSASAPPIWYLASLKSSDHHVAGVTLPGSPGVIIGHNERIAWGVTNLGPDVQDLYLEKFDASNPRRYQTPAGWREATVRHEEIKVRRGFADTATDSVTLDVTETRHGPIIYEKDGKRYALRWTALNSQSNELEAFHAINRARNWDEFRAALKTYPGPTQNFVYADTDGHIGYYGAGHIPIRRSGDGNTPYDGSTDAGEWVRFIPFEDLPHQFDPPQGIIVTANSRIAGRDYPYHLTNRWSSPYRARRIYNLLQAKPKLSVDDFLAIQGDIYSIGGALFVRETLQLARADSPGTTTAPDDAQWRDDLKLLENWDGRVSADSRAALLVSTMRESFQKRIVAAQLGLERERNLNLRNDLFVDEVITKREKRWLPKESSDYLQLLRECWREARQSLTKQFGPDEAKWTWGARAQVRFPHPLARAPLIGGQFTIPAFPQQGAGGNLQTVNVGANVSMRLVADTSDWDQTRHGIALGESGNPRDPHWKDQLDDWRNVTPRRLPFSNDAVTRAAQVELVLRPAP
jgi:penicillin amidase